AAGRGRGLQAERGPIVVDAEPVVRRMKRVSEVRLRHGCLRFPVPDEPILAIGWKIREPERSASRHRQRASLGRLLDAADPQVAREASATRGMLARARSVAAVGRAGVAVVRARATTRLETAYLRAAIAVDRVAVVAFLTGLEHPVAAPRLRGRDVQGELAARLPGPVADDGDLLARGEGHAQS